jgi:hypothetical protein
MQLVKHMKLQGSTENRCSQQDLNKMNQTSNDRTEDFWHREECSRQFIQGLTCRLIPRKYIYDEEFVYCILQPIDLHDACSITFAN